MLPETDVARVKRWVTARNEKMSPRVAEQLRYELDVAARAVTLVERRSPWREDLGPDWWRRPVARLRYTKVHRDWTLYWHDSDDKFHVYPFADPTPNVETLLAEIDADPTCLFWG
jgi:hypothetical protein